MQERERLGAGLLLITVAAIPMLFFLIVVGNPLLALWALLVETGLFIAIRVALSRPQLSAAERRRRLQPHR